MGEIVPFGKYQGQAVEVLATDAKYVQWLLAQPWFKEKHGSLHLTLINYGKGPEDTPEHNLMQARLADATYGGSFIRHLFTRVKRVVEEGGLERFKCLEFQFEHQGWDAFFRIAVVTRNAADRHDDTGVNYRIYVECKPIVGDDYPSVVRQVKRYKTDLGRSIRVVWVDKFDASVPLDTVRRMFPDIWWVPSSDIEASYQARLAALEAASADGRDFVPA